MAVTLKKICEEAGVSKATVSRVLNNHPLVSKETREKVQEVIKRLNFTPNALARNLSLQRTDTIGVLFPWIFSGFFSTVLLGIDSAAREFNYHVITSLSHDEEDENSMALSLLSERRIDGLILMAPSLPNEKIQEIKNLGIPFVVLQREIPDPEVSFVSVDNKDGGYKATQHLIGLGHRRIMAIAGPEASQDSGRRQEGYCQALHEAGIAFDPNLVIRSEFNKETALPSFEHFRQRFPMPDAIFCFNDDIALGLIKFLRTIGVKVPDDVAVVGFDGIEFTDFAELSTIATPMKEMGEQAVRLLVKQLENKEKRITEQWLLKGSLIERSSTLGLKPSHKRVN
jgi:DNA-binding LacI/PurR family transcriptional regulator